MGYPGAVESVDTQRLQLVDDCVAGLQGFTSLVLTTSGSADTQDSEQEATDRLLELGALNNSDGRLVPDLNPAVSKSCTSNTRH